MSGAQNYEIHMCETFWYFGSRLRHLYVYSGEVHVLDESSKMRVTKGCQRSEMLMFLGFRSPAHSTKSVSVSVA